MRPTIAAEEVLSVLRAIDARKLRPRLVDDTVGFRTYRLRNGWSLKVYVLNGKWQHLDEITTPDGARHDPWHYVYAEDHRLDVAHFESVRDFIPSHPKAYGLDSARSKVRHIRGFVFKPKFTKRGKRTFC